MDLNKRVLLTVENTSYKGIPVVSLRGEFRGKDGHTWVREELKKLLDSGETKIVIHLGKVGQIDSGGLGTLAEASITARKRGGEVKLAAPTEKIQRLLKITHLFTLFEIYPDTPSAVAAFGEGK